MKKRIAECSQCFNQSRENCSEPDSSLGSPEPAVSLDDNFDPSYQSRPQLKENMPLPNLEQERDPLRLYHYTLHPSLTHPTSYPCRLEFAVQLHLLSSSKRLRDDCVER